MRTVDEKEPLILTSTKNYNSHQPSKKNKNIVIKFDFSQLFSGPSPIAWSIINYTGIKGLIFFLQINKSARIFFSNNREKINDLVFRGDNPLKKDLIHNLYRCSKAGSLYQFESVFIMKLSQVRVFSPKNESLDVSKTLSRFFSPVIISNNMICGAAVKKVNFCSRPCTNTWGFIFFGLMLLILVGTVIFGKAYAIPQWGNDRAAGICSGMFAGGTLLLLAGRFLYFLCKEYQNLTHHADQFITMQTVIKQNNILKIEEEISRLEIQEEKEKESVLSL